MQQTQGSELTIGVTHVGPPLDRWMFGVVRRNGVFEWGCGHRHRNTAKAQVCAIRAMARIRRNDAKAAAKVLRNVTP